MNRPIFHLSLPVRDLTAAKSFYCDLLDATLGREGSEWVDVLIFGHQLTLHHRPDEVLRPDQRGVRHFGVVLPWKDWVALGECLDQGGCEFLRPPTISGAGTEQEYGKFLLCDPSDNVVEIKAYRNVAALLGAHDHGARMTESNVEEGGP